MVRQALYRKVDALGELCDWHEAEEAHFFAHLPQSVRALQGCPLSLQAATKLQATGEEGTAVVGLKRRLCT